MAFQLPPEVAYFVDRDAEQASALLAVAQGTGQDRPVCIALSGLGGAGKTELAFRLARRLRADCPDGVRYLDLDDLRHDGGVDTVDALGELLRGLGVGSDWLAPGLKARHRQYWERTQDKRLVVIVDNARYAAEVLPLLPASGRSVAIVASHGPLYDLPGESAVELPLPPLPDPYGFELLRRLVHDDARLDAEPEAALGVVRLCSGLPAALRVAGPWIRRHRRRPLARLLTELTVELHQKGLPVVEAVWDAAYRGLSQDGSRLYRLLADVPGPTFTPAAATALLGAGPGAADDALDELENAGLLDVRGLAADGSGGLRLPGLLRGHARRRADEDGDEGVRAAAVARIVRWYARQAQRADALTAGARMTWADPVPAEPDAPDVPFADAGAAARWLETERHALYAAVALAHRHGLDTEAWTLCEPLWTHFLDHRHYADVVPAFRTGLESALRAEHLPAAIRMRCQLARPLWEQRDFAAAGRELDHAQRALGLLGGTEKERKLGASVAEFRGMLRSASGDWAGAAEDFAASRAVHEAIENAYGVLLQSYRLGEAKAELGELAEAAELLTLALAGFQEPGRRRLRMVGRTSFALGRVQQALGRPAQAAELYAAALASARERGAEQDEVRALDALAELAEAAGDAAGAAEHRTAARTIRQRNGVVA